MMKKLVSFKGLLWASMVVFGTSSLAMAMSNDDENDSYKKPLSQQTNQEIKESLQDILGKEEGAKVNNIRVEVKETINNIKEEIKPEVKNVKKKLKEIKKFFN